jgi:hypothetical protein
MWAIAGIGLLTLIVVLTLMIQVEGKNMRGNKDKSTKF